MTPFEKLQKEKEKKQREEKLFSLLEIISKNVPKEQLDFGEKFDDIQKVLESQSNDDIIKAIQESKSEINIEKTDVSNIEKLLESIRKEIKPAVVNIPEQKPDLESHRLLSVIVGLFKGIKIPDVFKLNAKQHKDLVQGMEDVEQAVKGVSISVSAGASGGDANLYDAAGNPLLSHSGALNVHLADVHEEAVNDFFHLHDGSVTTLAVPIAIGDTSMQVVDSTGFTVGHHVHILNGGTEYLYPKITAVVGNLITVDSPFSNAYSIANTSVEHIIIDLSNTAGSLATPVSYKVIPQAGEQYHLLRMIGSIVSAAAPDDGRFGGLASLANGVVIRKYDGLTGTLSKFTAWHNNSDIINDMFDVVYSDAPKFGLYGTRFRWSISKVGVAVKLSGDDGDYLEILIQDDLTALDTFTIKAQGHSDV